MTGQSDKKQRVATVSMAASGFLTVAKFAVGLSTGSLAILSEALHSALDFAATIMTWFAVRLSDKPADERHHYGHGKVESVTALIETGLLFLTSAWVIQEAVKRLIWHESPVVVSAPAIAVVIASIAIDFWRARALGAVAEETRSHALEADALHFSSDMWSSAVVLVGLGVVSAGFAEGDSVAALAVACFVILAGWRLGARTIDVLMDAAPEGTTEAIRRAVEPMPGVVAIDMIRVRPAGGTLFVDLGISVPRTLPPEAVGDLRSAIERAVRAAVPEAEVTVAAVPIAIDDETVRDKVMVIAGNRRLAVHHVTVQSLGGRLSVSLDLEVDRRMALGEAHRVASDLETAIRLEFGPATEVETHIEPLEEDALEGHDVEEAQRIEIAQIIAGLTDAASGLVDAHNVRVRANDHGLAVTFHCRAAPELPVEEVHRRVDALEVRVREACPGIQRLITHAEPIRGVG
jgi:cation diffusion facilitator family transporter